MLSGEEWQHNYIFKFWEVFAATGIIFSDQGKNKHILKFLKPRYVSAGIIALQEKNEGESNLCK